MVEQMGFLGFGWEDKVVKRAKEFLFSSQNNSINSDIVELIHTKYLSMLSNGFKRINFVETLSNIALRKWDTNSYNIINTIKNELNLNIIIIDAVFRSIYELAINGKIPYTKLDPIGVQQDKIQADPLTDKNVLLQKLKGTFDTSKYFAIAGIGLGFLYLLTRAKK